MTFSDLRTGLVVGGRGRFGQAIVDALRDSGLDVLSFGSARRLERAATATHSDGAPHLEGDATDADAVNELVTRYRPSVLVVCAGAPAVSRPLAGQSWEHFSSPLETDVRIAFNCVRASLRVPLDPGSRIILLSSAAILQPHPLSAGYLTAKAAVAMLALSAVSEAALLGIGVQCLLPAIAHDTPMGARALREHAQYANVSLAQWMARASHTPRLSPTDVGAAVRLLIRAPETMPNTLVEVTGAGLRPVRHALFHAEAAPTIAV